MTNQQLSELNRKRKIRQICMVTRDLEKTMKNWVEYLGIGPWKVIAFTEKSVRNFSVHGKPVTEPFKILLAFSEVGDIEFELIQPVYGPNIYNKFLEEKGEGLHHIKEKISDANMGEVLADYKRKGIEVTQTGLFGASVHYYLNTEPFLDFIYELGNCPAGNIPPEMITIYPQE
jgi:methylmalonyl-CoA/ethylmalonyl-CoA epimerase